MPSSLLSRMAHPVRVACARTGISRARARRVRSARILTFHGIGVAEHPAEVLRAQLRFLRENFTIVPLEALLDHDASAAERGPIALTFDDGLRNQIATAVPLLMELSLPATFFVCPELVDGGRWQWCHDLRERLRSLDRGDRRGILRDLGAPSRDVERAIEWMKDITPPERASALERIRQGTNWFVPRPDQSRAFDVASWEQLAALPAELFTIGSHGSDHQVLNSLTPPELDRQIAGSRRMLESRLGRPVEWFSFPTGRYDDAVLARVRESYRGAVTMSSGFAGPGADRHLLPRINVTANSSLLAWRLHRPRR